MHFYTSCPPSEHNKPIYSSHICTLVTDNEREITNRCTTQ